MGLISEGKKNQYTLILFVSKVQSKVTLVWPHHLEAHLLCLPWFAAGGLAYSCSVPLACSHLPEEARRSRGYAPIIEWSPGSSQFKEQRPKSCFGQETAPEHELLV